ncbi:uncharacterized protein LOC141730746 isoform X5 [Zonotrichia albicollis]|uniref:uncharacterized protein LOC141730746 isoform X5 n=1 Tax=Zonotrichia albicollis TaxID=44394 RepID=UPI003D811107
MDLGAWFGMAWAVWCQVSILVLLELIPTTSCTTFLVPSESSLSFLSSPRLSPASTWGIFVDMTYLCIPASDSSSQNLLQHFKESIQFIHECRLAGGGCLVHCTAPGSAGSTAGIPSRTRRSCSACWGSTPGTGIDPGSPPQLPPCPLRAVQVAMMVALMVAAGG